MNISSDEDRAAHERLEQRPVMDVAKIEPRQYESGRTHSIVVTYADGRQESAGFLAVGAHDLGIAEHAEMITVTHGSIFYKGIMRTPDMPRFRFRKGEHITFYCHEPTFYFCRFINEND